MSFSEGYALLIGVGSHKNAAYLDVPISVEDARTVRDILINPAICGYPAGQVTLLSDEQANKDRILKEIAALAQKTKVDDTVFLFFCGHGLRGKDGSFYFVTHEAELTEDGRVRPDSGLSEVDLISALRDIQAKRLLLIFNACHSGQVAPSLGETNPKTLHPEDDTVDALLSTGEGRVVIVACREEQLSYIGSGQTTIFTTALVNGLKGKGVPNSGGYISAYALYEKVYRDVSRRVRTLYKVEQEPVLSILRGVGPFAVSLYKGADPSNLGGFPEDLPPPEGAVREVDPADARRTLSHYIGSVGDNSTVAQGDGATAVGSRGVYIRGKNTGTVVTGDDNTVNNRSGGDPTNGD